MTRDEYTQLGTMSDADLALKKVVDLATVQNLSNERQAAIDGLAAAQTTVKANLDAAVAAQKIEDDKAQEAAVKAATDPLNATIADLTTKLTALTAQLAGTAGSRVLTTTHAQEIGLTLEYGSGNETAALNASITTFLNQIAVKHAPTIMGEAIKRYPMLSPDLQAAVCAALGLPDVAKLDATQQMTILSGMGVQIFLGLAPDVQGKILTALGL